MGNVAQVSQAMRRVLTEAPEPAATDTRLARRRQSPSACQLLLAPTNDA